MSSFFLKVGVWRLSLISFVLGYGIVSVGVWNEQLMFEQWKVILFLLDMFMSIYATDR